uniref:Uncharacterized protein n=1 Tax=Molossus molossus TaxID=27622 RepID=A0A7J8DCE5_MOLMO|nr:hypothetical protein HJG59_009386 [Molossus molossus]
MFGVRWSPTPWYTCEPSASSSLSKAPKSLRVLGRPRTEQATVAVRETTLGPACTFGPTDPPLELRGSRRPSSDGGMVQGKEALIHPPSPGVAPGSLCGFCQALLNLHFLIYNTGYPCQPPRAAVGTQATRDNGPESSPQLHRAGRAAEQRGRSSEEPSLRGAHRRHVEKNFPSTEDRVGKFWVNRVRSGSSLQDFSDSRE